jgi:predicted ribosome quality control (RQC) complex YloA/Tae2 family protein
MQKMANLDYFFAAKELQVLAGARFRKLYETGRARFRLKLNMEGEINIVAELGVRLHQTKYLEEEVGRSNFVLQVNKILDNAVLEGVEQKDFDRVVVFRFAKRERHTLIFDMVAAGNLVLCGESLRVEAACRKLRKGEQYVFPKAPGQKVFGKIYLEEALLRAKKTEKTAEREADEMISSKPEPAVYVERDARVAFSPFPLTKFGSLQQISFPFFWKALDAYYEPQPAAIEVQVDSRVSRLEHTISEQETRLQEFFVKEKELREKGNAIYENFAFVKEISEKARELGKKADAEIAEKELNKIASKYGAKVFFKGSKIFLEIP